MNKTTEPQVDTSAIDPDVRKAIIEDHYRQLFDSARDRLQRKAIGLMAKDFSETCSNEELAELATLVRAGSLASMSSVVFTGGTS